jgi:beta-galactosidase
MIKIGEKNKLSVHADTRKHDSRWVPGAGIYRKVQLIVVDPIHVNIWGTFINTPRLTEYEADKNVEYSVSNLSNANREIVDISAVLAIRSKKPDSNKTTERFRLI